MRSSTGHHLLRTVTLLILVCIGAAFMPQIGRAAIPSTFGLVASSHRSLMQQTPSRRGRPTQLQMNLADRFFRVVKANINSVLQGLEDPEKILEQAVDDMQRDLIKVRQSYAEISATQKRVDRQKGQADNMANEWYKRAQLALSRGDEDLAREALARRQQQVEVANGYGEQMNLQQQAIQKLFTSMQQLEAKISEAKSKKDTMIARARTAKTSQQVNDMLSSMTGTTSMDAFDRMKEKVEVLESKAEVAGQLAGQDESSLEGKLQLLGTQSAVEDELQKMKGQLGSGRSGAPRGYLPPQTPEVEDELKFMREQLRQ